MVRERSGWNKQSATSLPFEVLITCKVLEPATQVFLTVLLLESTSLSSLTSIFKSLPSLRYFSKTVFSKPGAGQAAWASHVWI